MTWYFRYAISEMLRLCPDPEVIEFHFLSFWFFEAEPVLTKTCWNSWKTMADFSLSYSKEPKLQIYEKAKMTDAWHTWWEKKSNQVKVQWGFMLSLFCNLDVYHLLKYMSRNWVVYKVKVHSENEMVVTVHEMGTWISEFTQNYWVTNNNIIIRIRMKTLDLVGNRNSTISL